MTTATSPLRASAPPITQLDNLGLLSDLSGTWVGDGFNVVALPAFGSPVGFQVKAHPTRETITFSGIGGPIPNRGAVESDIKFNGIHYLQRVSDAITNAAMHVEPGLWLNMPNVANPQSTDPLENLLVRQASIPHGDVVLAMSSGPQVRLNVVPSLGNPRPNDAQFANVPTTPTPVGLPAPSNGPFAAAQADPANPANAVFNPDVVLASALASLNMRGTIVDNKVITVSSTSPS
jgi:hypothetical protein